MLYTLACGSVFLLAFLAVANPMKANGLANRWLGLFLFCLGCTLLGRALPGTDTAARYCRACWSSPSWPWRRPCTWA